MFTIEEKINETEELGKIINKIPLTKSRNERLTNKLIVLVAKLLNLFRLKNKDSDR